MIAALVDGHRQEMIAVADEGLLRGDGCFEAIRSYGGIPFSFEPHYERLTRSAAALDIPCPPATALRPWVEEMAAAGGDCVVRVVLTRGRGNQLPGHCVVLAQPLAAKPESLRLLPLAAPWHPGGESWELTGVKTISYAPNMAASRLARSRGFDDALLISRDGFVLEGPTFAVVWVRDGKLETPDLDLGILDSVTNRLVLGAARAAGEEVVSGRFRLESVLEASEVIALSTVKEVTPVSAVGAHSLEAGPMSQRLATFYRDLIADQKEMPGPKGRSADLAPTLLQ